MKTTKDWVCFIIAVIATLIVFNTGGVLLSILIASIASLWEDAMTTAVVYKTLCCALITANTIFIGASAIEYVRKRRD